MTSARPGQRGRDRRDAGKDAVPCWLAEATGLPAAGWSLERVATSRARGGAVTFRARHRDREGELAVKRFAQRWRAKAAFEASRSARDGGARVAAPLRGDAATGLFAAEWVAGESLRERLRRPGWERDMEAAGRWLRRLHRSAPVAVALWRGEARLARPRSLAPAGPSVPDDPDFAAALDRLAARARRVPCGPERRVRLHGDFHFHNLLFVGGRPVGIDLEQTVEGSRHDDLARMLVQIEMLAAAPDPSGAPGPDPRRARRSLLVGYGLWSPLGRARLALHEAAELLCRWRVASRPDRARPDRVAAVRAVLSRRGWAIAAFAFLPEWDGGERPGDAVPPESEVAAA